jgi:hypothetical protein
MPYEDEPSYACGCLIALGIGVAFWALLVFLTWWLIYR